MATYKKEVERLNALLDATMKQVKFLLSCEDRDAESFNEIPKLTDKLTEVRHIACDMMWRLRM